MNASKATKPSLPLIPASVRVQATAIAIERTIVWVGSPISLALHTIAFICFFAVSLLGFVGWDLMLLVLTTIVSLEAIYLAIFIQFSVNRQAASLKGVEEDVEELGEHVESIKEDVEDIQEDISEISDDADEDRRKKRQADMLEALTNDVKAMLKHIESLKIS